MTSRVAGWDITLVDTVADNASAGLFVLVWLARTVAALGQPLRSGEIVLSSRHGPG